MDELGLLIIVLVSIFGIGFFSGMDVQEKIDKQEKESSRRVHK